MQNTLKPKFKRLRRPLQYSCTCVYIFLSGSTHASAYCARTVFTYEQKGLGVEFDLLQGSKFPKESLLFYLAVPKSISHFLHDLYVKSKPCGSQKCHRKLSIEKYLYN